MTMDFNFVMPEKGKWNGGDMIYEFNGDDDLFIYVDGVKILDIGGDHDALPGKINFATGEITYYLDFKNDISENGRVPVTSLVPITIKGCFEKAGKFPDGTDWDNSKVEDYFNGNTFNDFSSHSFKMIYAEQGGAASNLAMRFNLPAIPPGSFTVEKKLDGNMKEQYGDREFEYMAFVNGNSHPVIWNNVEDEAHGYEIRPADLPKDDDDYERYDVVSAKLLDEGNNVIDDTLDIDEKGIFKLKAGQKAQFVCRADGMKYDVVEVNVPDDVQKTYVNDLQVAPDGTNWEPNADTYKADEKYNLDGIVPDYNNRYAPAGESTTSKRASVTFTNEMQEHVLEVQKDVEGQSTPADRFQFRVWLEDQEGKLKLVNQEDYDIYANNDGTWEYIRSAQTGPYGTILLGSDQKAVFRGLMKGTKYVVVEDDMPEGYIFNDITSSNYDEWSLVETDVDLWGTYSQESYASGKVKTPIVLDNDDDLDPNQKYTNVTAINKNRLMIQIWKVDTADLSKENPDHIGIAKFLVKRGTKYYVYTDDGEEKWETEPRTDGDGVIDNSYTVKYKDYTNVLPGATDDNAPTSWVDVTKDAGRIVNGVSGVYQIQEKEAPDGYLIARTEPVYFEVSLTGFGDEKYLRLVDKEGIPLATTDPDYMAIISQVSVDTEVDDDGDVTVTVSIGNEKEVPVDPTKTETSPYEGSGVLGPVKVGDEITYEIAYKNYKGKAATVTVNDKLDPYVEFVSAPAESADEAGVAHGEGTLGSDGVVTWTINNVPSLASGTVKLTVRVKEGALASKNGPGKVANGGNTTSVKVDGDPERYTNTVVNPVADATKTQRPRRRSVLTERRSMLCARLCRQAERPRAARTLRSTRQ